MDPQYPSALPLKVTNQLKLNGKELEGYKKFQYRRYDNSKLVISNQNPRAKKRKTTKDDKIEEPKEIKEDLIEESQKGSILSNGTMKSKLISKVR